MSERTTAELIETLGNDVDRCFREFRTAIDYLKVDANAEALASYEYHARQLIRAIFAFIEGVTFSMKAKAAEYCLLYERNLTDAERWLAVDIEYALNDKGEIVERPVCIRLADNIRFAFALQEKAFGAVKKFAPSTKWWSCLQASIKVRDRLTHPKHPRDIAVSLEESAAALTAFAGFKEQVLSYIHSFASFTTRDTSPSSPPPSTHA
jgi:hypothetical protein